MGFDLTKGEKIETGQKFDLSKGTNDPLKLAGVGLGWDANAEKEDPSLKGVVFDLDLSAFCLDSEGQIREMTDLVFYKSANMAKFEPEDEAERPYSTDGAVFGAIDVDDDDFDDDDDDDGDDEDMRIQFNDVASHIHEIVVCVTIAKFPHVKDRRTKDLNFGMVDGAYCRVWNHETDEALCVFELDTQFSNEDAVVFGSFTRSGDNWDFTADGKGYVGGLQKLISIYAKKFNG